VAMPLVGALAGLVALPLCQDALNAALEFAVLRGLFFRLATVDDFDPERLHLLLELAALKVVAMAAIDRLKPHTVDGALPSQLQQLLVLSTFRDAGPGACLVDQFGHNDLTCSSGVAAQAGSWSGMLKPYL